MILGRKVTQVTTSVLEDGLWKIKIELTTSESEDLKTWKDKTFSSEASGTSYQEVFNNVSEGIIDYITEEMDNDNAKSLPEDNKVN